MWRPEFGERVLVSPCHRISIGLTVSQSLAPPRDPQVLGLQCLPLLIDGVQHVAA
jgi:hypothetical protein